MLRLTNIQKNNSVIEADYSPENSQRTAHISLNIATKDYIAGNVEGYDGEYARMAANGLIRTLDELQSGMRDILPSERLVMWY